MSSSSPTPDPPAPEDHQPNECLYVVCCANSLKTDDGSFLAKCCPCFGSSPQIYLEFSRILGDGSPQMVHRTELVKKKDRPQWHPFELKLEQLCECDKSRLFLVECFQEDRPNPKLLGFACSTMAQLQSMDEQKRVVHLLDEHGHQSKSQIHFSEFQMRQQLLEDEAGIGTEAKVLAEVPKKKCSTKTHKIAPHRPDVHVSSSSSTSTIKISGHNNIVSYGGNISQTMSVHGGGISIKQTVGGGHNRVIVNGILYENGTSRALTTKEREKLNRPKVEQHAGGISVHGRHGQSLSVYGGHGGKVSVHGGHGGNVSVHEGHGGNFSSVHGGHGGNVTVLGGNVSSVRGGHGGNVTVLGGNVSSVHGGHGGNVTVKQHGVSSPVEQHGKGGVGHNCVIVNGILYENGTSRALTTEEREKLRRHNQAWQQWSKEFDRAGNSSSSSPEKPEFPCFCSSACAQSS